MPGNVKILFERYQAALLALSDAKAIHAAILKEAEPLFAMQMRIDEAYEDVQLADNEVTNLRYLMEDSILEKAGKRVDHDEEDEDALA